MGNTIMIMDRKGYLKKGNEVSLMKSKSWSVKNQRDLLISNFVDNKGQLITIGKVIDTKEILDKYKCDTVEKTIKDLDKIERVIIKNTDIFLEDGADTVRTVLGEIEYL